MVRSSWALQRASRVIAVLAVTVSSLIWSPPSAGAIDLCSSSYCADLHVVPSGAGTGRVTDDYGQIDCSWNGSSVSGTCDTTYVWSHLVPSIDVVLTEDPGATSYICHGTSSCHGVDETQQRPITLQPSSNIQENVTFAQGYVRTAHLVLAGDGSGRVTTVPSGIDCSYANGSQTGTCDVTWKWTSPLTLTYTVQPAVGDSGCFQGATISCALPGDPYVLTYTFGGSGTTTEHAYFVNGPRALAVTVQSGGTVTSQPAGITCPSTCTHDFNPGTQVQLTETPNAGYAFIGWSGACTGANPSCGVYLTTQDRTATATFAKIVTPAPSTGPTPIPTTRPTATPAAHPSSPPASTAPPASSGPAASPQPSPSPEPSPTTDAGPASSQAPRASAAVALGGTAGPGAPTSPASAGDQPALSTPDNRSTLVTLIVVLLILIAMVLGLLAMYAVLGRRRARRRERAATDTTGRHST